MSDHSTDIVSSIDTTGVAPGPHAALEGVTPVFDIEREALGYDEKREVDLGERFAEKAVAAGTEEYQEANTPDETSKAGVGAGGTAGTDDQAEGLPYAPAVTSEDTTGTDTTAAFGGEPPKQDQTDQVDTSGTGGEPNDSAEGNVLVASNAEGDDGSFTAQESVKQGEEGDKGDFAALTVTQLLALAKENDVEVPSGAKKAQIIDALVEAGVEPPSSEDDDSGDGPSE